VINTLRAHIRQAICDIEPEFNYPTRKRGFDFRARCLTKWFKATSEEALKLEHAITGRIPEECEDDIDDDMRDAVKSFKGYRHELVEAFKGNQLVSCYYSKN